MKQLTLVFVVMILSCLVCLQGVLAQGITTPKPSPKAVVMQEFGISKAKIVYHRPAVKERTVWGKLVPYGKVWRAGANDNTVIWLSHDTKVEGKSLKAGSYGLHMIPGKEESTVIFSTNSTSWGSYSYDEKEDALRVTVKNKSCPHHEMLTYDFSGYDGKEGNITCALSWGKTSIPFTISVDVPETVMANARNELRSTKGFTWQGWNSAAQFALNNDGDMEEALAMSQKSVKRQATFTNLTTHADILAKMGKAEDATKARKKAMKIATNAEINIMGYTMINQKKYDKAIELFKLNTEKHPDDPNVWDSLGEGYATRMADGDKKLAIKAFKKSLSMDPPENVRANSMKNLEKLGVEYAKGNK